VKAGCEALPAAAEATGRALGVARFAFLWLAGADLRMAVLALPPLMPQLRREFHLSEGTVGMLTSLPVLVLALGAVAGSAAVARLGARRALALGLVVAGCASALRGFGGVAGLFGASVVLGAGIATMQPTMPSVAQAWFPSAVGVATSIYGNGMVVGEAVAASLTLPLVLPFVGSWRAALAAWGVPALVAAALLAAPFARVRSLRLPGEHQRWWPDWSHALTWRVGVLQGGGSVLYFGTNAFVATYLHAVGQPGLVTACLAALNTSQLGASVIVAALARRTARPHGVLAASGVVAFGGLVGLVASPAQFAIVGCALAGLCSAVCFVVALSLPPMLADPGDVHRMAAGVLTIGYVAAFVFPLAGGYAWDVTGRPALAFVPAFAAALVFGSVLFWPGKGARELARVRIR
jgi:CP family cyanate transporter-like MFS transporter